MINSLIMQYLNKPSKRGKNCVSKKELENFIKSCYFKGKVEKVVSGTSISRYDITIDAKSINYFLTLKKQFNCFFDTNDCRVFQNGRFVCIEVPNKTRGIYTFYECVQELNRINDKDNKLYIPIGESPEGSCITYSICDMPHLLVCGQTGSGKSIFLHNIILSLSLQYQKEVAQFIFIDPKKVEFSFYKKLPQAKKYVDTTQGAKNILNELCDEMDDRYKRFARLQVRDIDSYNKLSHDKMPRIVLFIDELAELDISSNNEIMDSVQRIVLKARACGIHVIIATQRPDSDFMNGKIKNNFQCRAVFTMASVHDSKTVGINGSHNLKGKGDGLFRPNDGSYTFRFQAPMITEEEIKMVVNFIINKNKESEEN